MCTLHYNSVPTYLLHFNIVVICFGGTVYDKGLFFFLNHPICVMKNKSLQAEKEVAALKQLANIKPLVEISTLQNTVQSLTSQTHSLSIKEQARSQDFLALFNMTVSTTKTLTELRTNVNNRLNDIWHNQTTAIVAIENNVSSQLQSFQTDQNKTFMRLENMVQAVERSANGSHDLLQRQINKSSEKGS